MAAKPTKRSRGRPEAPGRHTIQVRVSSEERAAFERAADRCSYTLSEWARAVLRRAAGIQEPRVEPLERDE